MYFSFLGVCIIFLSALISDSYEILNGGTVYGTGREADYHGAAAASASITMYPRFISRGNTFRVVTGDTVVLPCEVQDLGSFVVVWKKGQALLSAGNQIITREPRISLLGHNLQIREIKNTDQGDYTCQIGDGMQGDLIHTVEILMPPSIQIFPPNGQITSRKGGPVSFECRASGNPSPVVQWTKKDGLLPSGTQVQTGYLLSFGDVQRQDAGVYQCTASNSVGQPVTGEITLQVLYPPEVKAVKTWVNTGEGLEAKLDCIVQADPPAEVLWYQDSFLLQPTDRRQMSNQGTKYSLIVRNVQVSDFGNYSCTVVNSIGREKRYIELSGKPGPAHVTSPTYSNPHEYMLQWSVQSVFPIQEVRILYRKISINASFPHSASQWHDLLVRPPSKFNSVTGERTQAYRISGLTADSTYECLVQTKNLHGFGELSDLHQWITSPKGFTVYNFNRSNSLLNVSFLEIFLMTFMITFFMIF